MIGDLFGWAIVELIGVAFGSLTGSARREDAKHRIDQAGRALSLHTKLDENGKPLDGVLAGDWQSFAVEVSGDADRRGGKGVRVIARLSPPLRLGLGAVNLYDRNTAKKDTRGCADPAFARQLIASLGSIVRETKALGEVHDFLELPLRLRGLRVELSDDRVTVRALLGREDGVYIDPTRRLVEPMLGIATLVARAVQQARGGLGVHGGERALLALLTSIEQDATLDREALRLEGATPQLRWFLEAGMAFRKRGRGHTSRGLLTLALPEPARDSWFLRRRERRLLRPLATPFGRRFGVAEGNLRSLSPEPWAGMDELPTASRSVHIVGDHIKVELAPLHRADVRSAIEIGTRIGESLWMVAPLPDAGGAYRSRGRRS